MSCALSLHLDEIQHRIIKQDKNADHDSHIVVDKNHQCQAYGITHAAASVQDLMKPQYAKWQQCHCIHPHYAPVVCHHIRAQRIQSRESHQGDIRTALVLFPDDGTQIHRHRTSGKSDLQKQDQRDSFH